MERLTSNKSVSEMNMYELAHNSCYAKDGIARYRGYDTDIDARELAIKLLEKYADIPNEFTCDEDFDDFMLDSLQYSTDSILGLIAVFYRNLWAMADLRERLKKYEDIGLMPEQLREIDKLYSEKCKELAELEKKSFSGIEMVKIWANLQKLKEYQNLEEQGKLLQLPCAVGDTVYTNVSMQGWYFNRSKRPYEAKVAFIGINGYDKFMNVDFGNGYMLQFKFWDIGKIIFFTKEEAEAALKEGGI